jgi:mono/diheme cytochrome c family protein
VGIAVFGVIFLLAAGGTSAQTGNEDIRPGLVAAYDDGKTRLRTVVPAARFYLEADESPHPAIAAEFQAEWTGVISILEAGEYRFDPGPAQLRVDGVLAAAGNPVRLAPGRHSISLRYRRAPGVAALQPQWQSAKFPLEPIPPGVFFHSRQQAPQPAEVLIDRGRELAEEFGCINCHRHESRPLRGRMGPNLSNLASRVSREWLLRWLESPWSFRGAAVMPAVGSEPDRRDIASYLATLGTPPQRRERAPRGGGIGQGASLFGSAGCAVCHQQEGLALNGMGSKMAPPALAAYLLDPAATDPGGRMPSLMLTKAEASQLAAYLTGSRMPEFERPWTGGDPARGKELVQSTGCLACHELSDGAPLQNGQAAKPLARLSSGKGCLAEQPPEHTPRYRLTGEQRSALNAFVSWYSRHPDVSPAPVYEVHTRLRQFRCTLCHQTDLAGDAPALSEATPPLTGVGAKLRTRWMERVLTGGARVRHWQTLRMPDYDSRHALPLAAALAKAEGVAPGDGPAHPQLADAQKTQGLGLIGTDPKQKGMACIGCHDWGKYKSLGEEGPQLIDAAERLRYNWYYRWMLNPARILSGTSMPNYFSSMDRTAARQTINTLWAALTAGARLPLPAGLAEPDLSQDREAHPVPDRRPIVVRWDMPEATPAAIAVGLPGGLSYCFDAGESRLRYAWRGGFLDLTETLRKKTDENRLTPAAKVVGEIFYKSDTFPLRVGDPQRIPARRFRGYRLVEEYPEFRYEVDGIEVNERISAGENGLGLTRYFTFGRVDRPMWFVDDSAGRKIEIPRGAPVRFTAAVPPREAGR